MDSLQGEATESRRRAWMSGTRSALLVGLAAGAVAQSFGRFTLGVLLPAIRDDLSLSNTEAGSLATVNVTAYLAGTLVVATTTSRYPLLPIMRTGMVVVVVGLLLAAVSPGALVLVVALALMGLGGALTWIPAPVVAADSLPAERRRFAVGFITSSMGVGVVFSGQLAGFVRSTMGDDSWRTVYLVQSLIAIVVVAAASTLVSHDQQRPSAKAGIGGSVALQRMQGWLPLTLAYTVFGLMYLLVVAFLTTRLEDDSGWTSSRASLAFTLLGVAMIFGGPLSIATSRRFGPRVALAIGFAAWAITTLLILPGWLGPALTAAIGSGLLFTAVPTVIMAYVVANTTRDDFGPSFAAATLAFGVAQMISPQLGGWLADATGSFTSVFLLSAGLAIIGLTAALKLPASNPHDERDQS